METIFFVSVVVPTYNRCNMLGNCLNSLFAQTYPANKLEVIVVNDGSTDRTEDILRKYENKAPCAFKWMTIKNKGSASARNQGIKKSKGELICFIDDDCIATRTWVENLIKKFRDDEIVGIGGKIQTHKAENIFEKYGMLMDQEKTIKENSGIITSNCAFRKKILEKIDGFDENLRNLEDFDLGLRARMQGWELSYSPKAIVWHRHRSNLKQLLKQHYFQGIGLAVLCKKHNFFPLKYQLYLRLLRAVKFFILLSTHLLLFKKEKASMNFIHLLTTFSQLLGLIKGIFFNKYFVN